MIAERARSGELRARFVLAHADTPVQSLQRKAAKPLKRFNAMK